MRSFAIVQMVYQEQGGKIIPPVRPFKLLETYSTLDGPRSRIVDGFWETMDAAKVELRKQQAKLAQELEKDFLRISTLEGQ